MPLAAVNALGSFAAFDVVVNAGANRFVSCLRLLGAIYIPRLR